MTTADLHPVDHLRHMTSASALVAANRSSQRFSQHLRMSPNRSPTSIPSSPTSVHSSSSAIFERDIEPLSPPSPQPHPHHLHHHPPNPHRIPRSKTTEQLEHSVPSVLDSAAAILASINPENEHQSDQIAVVSPTSAVPPAAFGSGFASPIGSFRSRSPSPTIGSFAAANQNQNRGSLLLNIPSPGATTAPISSSSSSSPPLHARPIIATATATTVGTADSSPSAPPSVITPTSTYFTTASGSEPNSPSPTTTTLEHPSSPLPTPRASSSSPPPIPYPHHHSHPYSYPLPSASTSSPHDISIAPLPPLSSPQTQTQTQTQTPTPPTSQPQSPIQTQQQQTNHQKRLSFISYSDLLASSPTSTLPLSQLTTGASSLEPPHIPSVSGLNVAVGLHPFLGPGQGQAAGSPNPSLRGFAASLHNTTGAGGGGGSVGGSSITGIGVGVGVGVTGIMDEGGEWEREGLGRGLEERLDWVR